MHFIDSRELNIKRVTRERSCFVLMNLTCFNKLIEYTNWSCLSVDIIQQQIATSTISEKLTRWGKAIRFEKERYGVFLRFTEVNKT